MQPDDDTLEGLRAALNAEGEAVARLIALCAEPRSTREDRHRALAVYEQRASFADAMMDAAIAAPAPGLAALVKAASDAAFWRMTDAGAIVDPAAYQRAYAVASHALAAMEAREGRVQAEVVEVWAERQLRKTREAA